MKSQHTPGPWEISQSPSNKKDWWVEPSIAHVYCDVNDEATTKANALLIKAAPELLKALIKIKKQMDLPTDHTTDSIIIERIVSEALAKATGEKEVVS